MKKGFSASLSVQNNEYVGCMQHVLSISSGCTVQADVERFVFAGM